MTAVDVSDHADRRRAGVNCDIAGAGRDLYLGQRLLFQCPLEAAASSANARVVRKKTASYCCERRGSCFACLRSCNRLSPFGLDQMKAPCRHGAWNQLLENDLFSCVEAGCDFGLGAVGDAKLDGDGAPGLLLLASGTSTEAFLSLS